MLLEDLILDTSLSISFSQSFLGPRSHHNTTMHELWRSFSGYVLILALMENAIAVSDSRMHPAAASEIIAHFSQLRSPSYR